MENYRYWTLLIRGKFLILAFVIVSTAAAVFSISYLPKIYVASSTILILQENTSSFMQAQIALGNLFNTGEANTLSYIEALLESRTFAGEIVKENNLANDKDFLYQITGKTSVTPGSVSDYAMAKGLSDLIQYVSETTGRVHIITRSLSPQLAAKITNAIVKALEARFNSEKDEKVNFLSSQAERFRVSLEDAQNRLRDFEENYPDMVLNIENKGQIDLFVDLEKQNIDLETRLKGLEKSLQINPDIKESLRIEREIASVKASLGNIKSKITEIETIFHGFPKEKVKYVNIQRDMTISGALYEHAVQQLEIARMEQMKNQSTKFIIIDDAVPPKHPEFPRKFLILLIGLLVGLFFGMLAVFVRELLNRSSRSEEDASAGGDAGAATVEKPQEVPNP